MDRMTLSVLGVVVSSICVSTTPLQAQQDIAEGTPVTRWMPIIEEAAARFGVPAAWIRDVMTIESGGRIELDGLPITSSKGAMGLMQVMPETYAEMRRAHGLGADPYLPRDNIFAGAAYLRTMHDRFGWPGLFAAYNAGPSRYDEHLRTGRALPNETIAYLSALETWGAADVLPPPHPILKSNSRTNGDVDFVSGRSIFFVRNGVHLVQNRSPQTISPDHRATPIFVPLSRERR